MKHSHIFFYLLLFFTSCKKSLEVDIPAGTIMSDLVFADSGKADAALIGIYGNLVNTNGFARWWTTLYCGYSSDEIDKYNADATSLEFINNQISVTNNINYNLWKSLYSNIYYANVAIEGLSLNRQLGTATRNRLWGEAKFIRAFCYFYLLNLYGEVPLVTSTDYAVNATLPRSRLESGYALVGEDLNDAIGLFASAYEGDNKRPGIWSARALLARVYLFNGNWTEAGLEADTVIQSGLFSLAPTPSLVFARESPETIWQLAQSATTVPEYSYAFRSSSVPGNILRQTFMEGFETKDQRKTAWTDSLTYLDNKYYRPGKYKSAVNTQYLVVFRLAEQILIKAEADAHTENFSSSINMLNEIRQRAGLDTYSGFSDTTALLVAIDEERKKEFFAEWGHRWMDLKRRGTAADVLTKIKPQWVATSLRFPVPQNELIANYKLTQNEGY